MEIGVFRVKWAKRTKIDNITKYGEDSNYGENRQQSIIIVIQNGTFSTILHEIRSI